MMKETDSGLLVESDENIGSADVPCTAAELDAKIKEGETLIEAGEEQEEPEEFNEFDQLIGLMLELDPNKYAGHWEPVELQKMREIISAGNGKFPKKVRPYIHLIRKFLFANAQLIAMSALAHQTAIRKGAKKEQLIKPASFSDLGKVEASRMREE